MKIKESEKRDKYLDLAREQKKTVEHEGGGDTNCCWSAWNALHKLGERLEERKIKGRIETIVEIG